MRQARARAAIGCVCECAYTRAPSAQVIGILLGLGVPYALHRAGLSENPRRHACAHAHARQKQPRVSARNCDAHTVTAYPCWTTTLAYHSPPFPPPPRHTPAPPRYTPRSLAPQHSLAAFALSLPPSPPLSRLSPQSLRPSLSVLFSPTAMHWHTELSTAHPSRTYTPTHLVLPHIMSWKIAFTCSAPNTVPHPLV